MQGNAHRQLPALREEYSKKERTETTMRNNYEASEVFEFGYAHDVVRGQKPVANEVDSILGIDFRAVPEQDIDETDE
jgi:hypothetical protein